MRRPGTLALALVAASCLSLGSAAAGAANTAPKFRVTVSGTLTGMLQDGVGSCRSYITNNVKYRSARALTATVVGGRLVLTGAPIGGAGSILPGLAIARVDSIATEQRYHGSLTDPACLAGNASPCPGEPWRPMVGLPIKITPVGNRIAVWHSYRPGGDWPINVPISPAYSLCNGLAFYDLGFPRKLPGTDYAGPPRLAPRLRLAPVPFALLRQGKRAVIRHTIANAYNDDGIRVVETEKWALTFTPITKR